MNYAELIRCLLDCWDDSTGPSCDCDHCLFRDKIVDDVGYTDYTKCETAMVLAAADAIEKLTAELEYTKRQYDLAVEDLEKIGWGEWIPATEKPPLKVGDDGYNGYLVYANGYYAVADYTTDKFDNVPCFHVNGEYEPDVTHYMPLPEPPKEKHT